MVWEHLSRVLAVEGQNVTFIRATTRRDCEAHQNAHQEEIATLFFPHRLRAVRSEQGVHTPRSLPDPALHIQWCCFSHLQRRIYRFLPSTVGALEEGLTNLHPSYKDTRVFRLSLTRQCHLQHYTKGIKSVCPPHRSAPGFPQSEEL